MRSSFEQVTSPLTADKASIQRNAERVSERLRDYDKDRPPGLMLFSNCRKSQEMFASIAVDENDSSVPDKKSPLKHWFDVHAYAAARADLQGGAGERSGASQRENGGKFSWKGGSSAARKSGPKRLRSKRAAGHVVYGPR